MKRYKKKQSKPTNFEDFIITYNVQDADNVGSDYWAISEKVELKVMTEKVSGMHDTAYETFLDLSNFREKESQGRLKVTCVAYV